ncbi:hypothetical protein [Gloeothece verrucosa]|uniref:Uncharacterized protein n=1 Tax=Gloeothece verrucosa (strain PCC 7822) TaxID=497965 RepID=E0UD52_GLOV7|nr:hypothetical protein [Gloeothece verrucosa]ADN12932.1 hypothetical protein Cyan7822_0918 [Gloeothece verrucosa PCC 7822]
MKSNFSNSKKELSQQNFSEETKNSDYYLQFIDSKMLNSFTPEQLETVRHLINLIIFRSSPKIVDLRFTVDLIFIRYFFVFLVGKDRRNQKRNYIPDPVSRWGNLITVVFIIISFNLLISSSILLGAYLVKSLIGINLFPKHFHQTVQEFILNGKK